MTPQQFIEETEYANNSLLNSIWQDFNRAEELKSEIEEEHINVHKEYNRSIAMQNYAEDPDDVMQGVARYWDNYFGADKNLYHKNEKLRDLTSLLAARELSFTNLSGSLLETAKKGLSLIYGKPMYWPKGRNIGTQSITNIIYQARNQSAHIDEAIRDGGYQNINITNCFTELSIENLVFADFVRRDMSFEIIKLLGWKNLKDFNNDFLNIK